VSPPVGARLDVPERVTVRTALTWTGVVARMLIVTAYMLLAIAGSRCPLSGVRPTLLGERYHVWHGYFVAMEVTVGVRGVVA